MNKTVSDRLYAIERQLERYRVAPTGGGVSPGGEPKNYATIVVKPFDSQAPDTADVLLTGTNDDVLINAVIAPFRRVEFLDGHIRLGGSIELCDNLCIEGQGTEITIFEFNPGTVSGFYIMQNVSPVDDVISDLELRRYTMNGGETTGGGGFYFQQPGGEYNTRVLIEDVDFVGIDTKCIYFECSLGLWINRCMFYDGNGLGIETLISHDVRVTNCTFDSSKTVALDAASKCLVHGCTFDSTSIPPDYSLSVENAFLCIVSNNIFSNIGLSSTINVSGSLRTIIVDNAIRYGSIRVSNCDYASVVGNNILTQNDYCIELISIDKGIISSNQITSDTDGDPQQEAYVRLYVCYHCLVTANKFVAVAYNFDRRSYGVFIDNGTGNAICFNDFTECFITAKVHDTGLLSVIRYNVPFDAADTYTDEQARDAICAMFAAGTHSGITFACDDNGDSISATVTGTIQHDHTGPSDGGVLTNDQHDGYSEYAAIASPTVPDAGKMRFYAKTSAGITKGYLKLDNGAEIEIGSGGGGGAIPQHYDFQPEFPNAVFVPATIDHGTLLPVDDSAARYNAYGWTTSQVSDQTIQIIVRWRLSPRFSTWGSQFKMISKVSNAAGTCAVELMEFLDTAGANVITPASKQNANWTEDSYTITGGTWTPSGIVTLRFRLHAANDEYAYLGPIYLAYNEE